MKKRVNIDERIQSFIRIPKQEAFLEEINGDESPEYGKEEDNRAAVVRERGRLDIRSRP